MTDTGRSTFLSEDWSGSPKFREFAIFLGLNPNRDSRGINYKTEKRLADKMEKIYAWGKLKSGSEDAIDIMITVKQAIRDLGVNFRGETLINHLFGFVTLDTKTIDLDAQKERIEKEKEIYKNPLEEAKEENVTQGGP